MHYTSASIVYAHFWVLMIVKAHYKKLLHLVVFFPFECTIFDFVDFNETELEKLRRFRVFVKDPTLYFTLVQVER